ncbi:MAG: hypothetical protein BMS9Abin29_2649 [Gemmatimonadota bacterium]|nr:MAG: hypothetical protein BMS9Abin29_2649 [Gemmatimonadota bacterium]
MSMLMNNHTTPREGGFTIIELLVVSVVGLVVVLGAYQLLVSQSRMLTQQRELVDARDSARGGATLLAWELKSVSASGGDLYAIDPDFLVIRSVQATGVICSWSDTGAGESQYGLRQTSGQFSGTVNDSAMIFSVIDNTWGAYNVTSAWTGSDAWTAGSPVCFWGDSTTAAPRPEAAIEIDTTAALANLEVGGPVHVFRKTTYALSQRNGRWWLGRQVGTSAWELLTGPMRSPTNGGLTFRYYDAVGDPTTNPLAVVRVEFTLRAESFGSVSPGGATGGVVEDSTTTTVFLRNTS